MSREPSLAGVDPDQLTRLPPRILPLLYFGSAHISLALACLLVAWAPRAIAGFYYHSWMIAIVHLITLGWITLSILGAIYIVGPTTLGMPLRARRGDYVAYAFAVIGVIGMVGHFWIQEFGGMAWSAATATAGIAYVAARVLAGLRRSAAPAGVRLHLLLACLNVFVAASMGILLGLDKVYHFLPGFVLSNVFAHAHLAAIGWATMMVVGVGYRLIPMTLLARAPSGPTLFASAVLIELGVLGLFVSLLRRSAWSELFGPLVVAGLLAFAVHVVQMIRRRQSRRVGAPGLDFAVLHAASAGVWLVLAAALGLALLFASPSAWTLRAGLAYGVFGLLGFLAQMVVAMEAQLVPLLAWYWASPRAQFGGALPPPRAMCDRMLQGVVFLGWAFAVPAIAGGLFCDASKWLAAGAWVLFAAVLGAALNNGFVLAYAFGREHRIPASEWSSLRSPSV